MAQREILTNSERFLILSQPYIRQVDVGRIMGCTGSNISKKISAAKKEKQPQNPFGTGYKAEDVIKFFDIDFNRICELAIIEAKINSSAHSATKA